MTQRLALTIAVGLAVFVGVFLYELLTPTLSRVLEVL